MRLELRAREEARRPLVRERHDRAGLEPGTAHEQALRGEPRLLRRRRRAELSCNEAARDRRKGGEKPTPRHAAAHVLLLSISRPIRIDGRPPGSLLLRIQRGLDTPRELLGRALSPEVEEHDAPLLLRPVVMDR